MSDNMTFDYGEFDRLSADIAEAPKNANKGIMAAFKVTSHNVRDGWREKLSGSPGFEALPYAITYDVEQRSIFGVGMVTAEIGADKSRAQGPLANISEFGSIKHPPRGYGHAALQEQHPDFEKGLGIAIGDIL